MVETHIENKRQFMHQQETTASRRNESKRINGEDLGRNEHDFGTKYRV